MDHMELLLELFDELAELLEYSGHIEPPNPRVRATQSAGESH